MTSSGRQLGAAPPQARNLLQPTLSRKTSERPRARPTGCRIWAQREPVSILGPQGSALGTIPTHAPRTPALL